MKRRLTVALATLFFSLVPQGFAPASAARDVVAGEAAPAPPFGGDVAAVSQTPQRVLSLSPSVTELLFALGAAGRVVGVTEQCDHPPEASRLPRAGTFLSPVVESVISLRPDLVITAVSPGNRVAVEAIERTGIKVLVVADQSLGDLGGQILTVADAIGAGQRGRELAAAIEEGMAATAARVAGLPRPRAALVVGVEPLVLAGPDSYLGELLEVAGGHNVAAAAGGAWPRVSLEYLLAARPEVMVDLSMGSEAAPFPPRPLERWGRYGTVPAVVSGRVHRISGSAWLRPGPRTAQAAAELAELLHPETSP